MIFVKAWLCAQKPCASRLALSHRDSIYFLLLPWQSKFQLRSLRRELPGNSDKASSVAPFLPAHLGGGGGPNHILSGYFFFHSPINYIISMPSLLHGHSTVRCTGRGPVNVFFDFYPKPFIRSISHFCMAFCSWMRVLRPNSVAILGRKMGSFRP